MQIIPAIDILGGKVVRLFQGDYGKVTKYEVSAEESAKEFEKAGAKRIHVVDLDGAKEGTLTNFNTVKRIRESVDVEVEIGGGIRSIDDIKAYLDIGISYVILGTKAVMDFDFFEKAASSFENKLIAGVDVKDGKAATEGWISKGEFGVEELFNKYASLPLANIIYTDIQTDGALTGVNIESLNKILSIAKTPLILSGGVSSIEDIYALSKVESPMLAGVISGRALYDGRLNLANAVKVFEGN